MSTTEETKEPTTTATLEDGGGEGEGEMVVINTIPSFASRLNKRADLLRRIFSFHKTRNPKEYIDLRSSSKLFHRALPLPPLWTSFPHSNYATLQSLLSRIEQLHLAGSSGNVPSLLFIEEGEYVAQGKCFVVMRPLSIYGAGREKTTLVGVSLHIRGMKSNGIVEIEDLKIQGGEGDAGLYADGGMNVIMRGVSIVDCPMHGVIAWGADITCDDLQVVGCGHSGVCAANHATITLSGQGTSIQRNGTSGSSYDYGLKKNASSFTKIYLVHPLTKEQISTNNSGGRNWGGGGTIEQVSK